MSKAKEKLHLHFGNPRYSKVENIDLFGTYVFNPAPQDMQTGLDNVFDPPDQRDGFTPLEEFRVKKASVSDFEADDHPAEEAPGEELSDFDVMRNEIEEMLAEAEKKTAEADAREADARKEADRIIREAEEKAQRLQENARNQTEQMIEQARRQVEDIEARAYQAGFEQGEEAGKQLGEQKMDSITRSLTGVIDEAVSQRQALMRDSEEELVKMAYDIGLKLICRELRQDPGVIHDVVRSAIEKARNATRITVLLSPHDFRFMQDQLEELKRQMGEDTVVRLEANPDVGRGGCRIISNAGEVDARLEHTLGELQKEIWSESDPSEKSNESPFDEVSGKIDFNAPVSAIQASNPALPKNNAPIETPGPVAGPPASGPVNPNDFVPPGNGEADTKPRQQ
ncbi:MAG: FliH/SctL family protein [Candidatus Sumerlaeia bacterium]